MLHTYSCWGKNIGEARWTPASPPLRPKMPSDHNARHTEDSDDQMDCGLLKSSYTEAHSALETQSGKRCSFLGPLSLLEVLLVPGDQVLVE